MRTLRLIIAGVLWLESVSLEPLVYDADRDPGAAFAQSGAQTVPAAGNKNVWKGALEMIAKEAVYDDRWSGTTIEFSLENRATFAFGVGILSDRTSIGTCVGKEESQAIGLGLLSQKALGLLTTSQELEKVLRKLEPSEKIVASVEVFRCHELKDITSAPITISFVLGVDKDLIVLPLSAPAIPVRVKPR